MINKYLKNLNRIEFVVTTACTGRCRHCSQGDHKSSENIDKFLAADAVRKIAREYNIKSVMTFGGESLLYSDTVCEIHKAASEMGIPERQLITNGYFSKDYYVIKSVARNIAESGVNEILLSADAFHQETVPIEFVKEFANSVKVDGIELKVQPAWLVSSDDNNEYNIRTREILAEFNKMGIDTNEGNVIFPSGNALVYLKDYFDENNLPENPYREDPENIKAICFSANGDILGDNIYNNDIIKILSSYDPINTDFSAN